MKIRNIRESNNKRICYFDLLLEDGKIILKKLRLIKLGNNCFKIGMISSSRNTNFTCEFCSEELEDQIIDLLLKMIPNEWIEKAEEIKYDQNNNKILLTEIEL